MEVLVLLYASFPVTVPDELICHYCTHSRKSKDVHDGENQNPDCMNKLKFGSREEMRRLCTPLEEYCASTVTNLNGFLVLVERGCAEECIPGTLLSRLWVGKCGSGVRLMALDCSGKNALVAAIPPSVMNGTEGNITNRMNHLEISDGRSYSPFVYCKNG